MGTVDRSSRRDTQDPVVGSAEKYLLISAIALTLYDYLLMFDDEIRYVWKGRKTWIFYLYILNRSLLVVYQIWEIYHISSAKNSETVCLAGYYIHVLFVAFFTSSSDVFIMLRVYAITCKNKIIAAYFGILLLARLAVSLGTTFNSPPVVVKSPPVSVDVSESCGLVTGLHSKLAVGTVSVLSALIVIVWCTYRNKGTLKPSGLVRVVIKEATIYFLVMVATQIYSLVGGSSQQLSLLVYGLLNPILTLRFAISLKKLADPEGGQKWQLEHFSAIHFAGNPPPDAERSSARESIEMDSADRSQDRTKIHEA